MLPRHVQIVLLVSVITATLGCAASATPGGLVGPSPAAVRQLAQGVFEVVVPKLEDEQGAKYAVPLPTELVPFARRNDKFAGIGTAFALSPTRFVTAAHVMPLVGSYSDHYYLRDSSGATYEVGRITKYSQTRDLAEFELLTPAAGVVPLEPRTDVAIGEMVFTVGNAIGEGIVARGGTITSRTPEPVEGKWSFLRFTAPASPGNSGGPLVDAAGRVLGVVVRKSAAENLNEAVPIAELLSLGSSSCELLDRGLLFADDNKEMLADWAFSAPLPESLASLRVAAGRSLDDFVGAQFAAFDAKYGAETFPNAPRLRAYLRELSLPGGLGKFQVDGTGKWEILGVKFDTKELSPGQYARFYADGHGRGELLLDRPPKTPLASFFEAPKLIADALVKNYGWGVYFEGRPILLETLGAPETTDRWQDDYGRPWFTFGWRMRRNQESLLANCLTNPAGWACIWSKGPMSVERFVRAGMKRQTRRITAAYFGNLRSWAEYLTLPVTYRPPLLAAATLTVDSRLTFSFPPFSGSVDLPLPRKPATLDVFMGIDPVQHKEHVAEVRLWPDATGKTYSLSVAAMLSPVEGTSRGHAQAWKNVRQGSPPFDNVAAVEGQFNVIKRPVTPAPAGSGQEEARYHTMCRARTDAKDVDIRAICSKFQEGITASPRP